MILVVSDWNRVNVIQSNDAIFLIWVTSWNEKNIWSLIEFILFTNFGELILHFPSNCWKLASFTSGANVTLVVRSHLYSSETLQVFEIEIPKTEAFLLASIKNNPNPMWPITIRKDRLHWRPRFLRILDLKVVGFQPIHCKNWWFHRQSPLKD